MLRLVDISSSGKLGIFDTDDYSVDYVDRSYVLNYKGRIEGVNGNNLSIVGLNDGTTRRLLLSNSGTVIQDKFGNDIVKTGNKVWLKRLGTKWLNIVRKRNNEAYVYVYLPDYINIVEENIDIISLFLHELDMDEINIHLKVSGGKNIKSLCDFFRNTVNLIALDISDLHTENLEGVDYLFGGCSQLKSIIYPNPFLSKNCISTYYMFARCRSMVEIDFTGWDTSGVEDFDGMFSNCKSLKWIDLTKLSVERLESCSRLFLNCDSLQYVNMSNFDFPANLINNNAHKMFSDCDMLKHLVISDAFAISLHDFGRFTRPNNKNANSYIKRVLSNEYFRKQERSRPKEIK